MLEAVLLRFLAKVSPLVFPEKFPGLWQTLLDSFQIVYYVNHSDIRMEANTLALADYAV